MNKRVRLQKPPTFGKLVSFPTQPISELSTLRTKQSKGSDSQRNLETQVLEQLFPSQLDIRYSTLCSVLSNPQYSHRPISIVSTWGSSKQILNTFLQQLTAEYNGWLEDEYNPNFSIVSNQLTDNFILQEEFKLGRQNNSKLLLDYTISNIIFIIVKDDDQILQGKILKFCQTIGDNVFYDNSLDCIKPLLVLCKVTKKLYSQSFHEKKWKKFVSRLFSWRHFRQIQILEMSSSQLEPQIIEFQRSYSSTKQQYGSITQIKQIIRKQGKPKGVFGQIFTGKIMASMIKNIYFCLVESVYTNILSIIKDTINEERQVFQRQYGVQFNRLLDQQTNSHPLRRYSLFRCVLDCRQQAAKLFNNFGVNGRHLISKKLQHKELQLIHTSLQYKRQQNNNNLFQLFEQNYLCFRPVSFTNCKKMIKNIEKQYINDGQLNDLKQFFFYLIENYADQLAWGDELNSLNLKEKRIDQFMIALQSQIKQNWNKINRIKNKEGVRLQKFEQKQKIAEDINKSKKINLQLLFTQKIKGQQEKIKDFKIIIHELTQIQHLTEQITKQQTQHTNKISQIQILNQQLQQILIEQQKQNKQILQLKKKDKIKIKRKNTIQIKSKNSPHRESNKTIQNQHKQQLEIEQQQEYYYSEQYISETEELRRLQEQSRIKQQQRINKEKIEKERMKRKKKGICSCFGF